MDNLREVISQNLVDLRKRKKYTQADVAEILQYSDKAISKWENGESLPDIEVLYKICNLYGVTLDYLTHEGNHEEKEKFIKNDKTMINKIVVALLSISLVWFIIIIGYVYPLIFANVNLWILFIWGVPISTLLVLIFNCIWGRRRFNYLILTVFIWTLITAIFLVFIYLNLSYQIWALFLLGIPAQIAIILWSQIKK